MTEAGWLECADPFALAEVYRGVRSVRKWRMFAVAGCRSVWHHLSEWGRRSLAVLEQVADGELPDSARAEESRNAPEPRSYADRAVWKAIRRGKEAREYARWYIPRHVLSAAGPHDGDPDREAVRRSLVEAARDVFGNPFRLPMFDRTWLTPTVASLALAAYEYRELPSGHLNTARLAVLSDALEEAGCTGEILSHLHSPGPHVRGCFAVDAVLARG